MTPHPLDELALSSRTRRARLGLKEGVETLSLAACAALVILYSVADLLGLLDGLPFLRSQAPVITLAALGAILAYLLVERRSSIERLHTGIDATLERLGTLEARLLLPELIGVEVFATTDEMMRRITAVTVGCERVHTLNLSPPAGVSSSLDTYMEEVHRYLHSGTSALQSFRIIASLESAPKALSVIRRAEHLAPTGKVSCAILPTSVLPAEAVREVLLPFHIVTKAGVTYVFFYRHNMHFDPTAVSDCFLLKNSAVGRVMTAYFERLWQVAVPLHVGRRIDARGLAEIVSIYPSVGQDPSYTALSGHVVR